MKHRESRSCLGVVIGLALAGTLAGGRPCSAQGALADSAAASPAAATRKVRLKDPRLAFLIGVVSPGLGHHYTGEHTRAVIIEGGAGAALLGACYFISRGLDHAVDCAVGDSSCTANADWRIARNVAAGGALAYAVAGVWVYGAIDAPRSARRVNERRSHVRRTSRLGGVTPFVGRVAGGLGVGASIAFR